MHRLAAAVVLAVLPAVAQARDGLSAGRDGIRAEVADGAIKLVLGGKLQLDALRADGDATTTYTDAGVRRARIDLRVELVDALSLRAEREFAGSKGWRNLYALLRPAKGVTIQGGQINAPFSMEDMQSSAVIPFAERSLAASLTAEFGLGGQIAFAGRRFTARAGYFANALDTVNGPAPSQGRGISARATVLALDGKRTRLHLGAGIDRRSFRPGETIRYSAEAGSTFGPRILRTPQISGLASRHGYNGEAALLAGPFMLQGQYVRQELNLQSGRRLSLSGGYAQAGWMVTGQPYRYARSAGVVGGPDMEDKSTALELAARVSWLDADNASIDGGSARSLDLAANLYLGQNLRLTAAGTHSRTRQRRTAAERDVTVALVRVQLAL